MVGLAQYGVDQARPPHDLHRNAIGQTIAFVEALPIKF